MVKGILFNGEMVKAILNGRKSCTRRLLKQPFEVHPNGYITKPKGNERLCPYEPPYQVGDILYVREMQSIHRVNNIGNKFVRVHFKVDNSVIDFMVSDTEWKRLAKYDYTDEKFISPYWTTKETCRLFLKVTDVRVERLREMNTNDFLNEGICLLPQTFSDAISMVRAHAEKFKSLWNFTVSEDWQKWENNPYVWVISFERCEKPEEGGKEV